MENVTQPPIVQPQDQQNASQVGPSIPYKVPSFVPENQSPAPKKGHSVLLIVILFVLLLIISVAGGAYYFIKNSRLQSPERSDGGQASLKQNLTPTQTVINSPIPTIDETASPDENQSLSENDIKEIKNEVSQRDGIPIGEMIFSIDNTNSKSGSGLASGNIGRTNEAGGGKWFAARINSQWKIVWTGNGLPECSDIAKYNLPKEFLNCY